MAIQSKDVLKKAAELDITLTKTVKSRKSYWELNVNNAKISVIGNKAAMDVMNIVVASKKAVGRCSQSIKIKNGVLENPNKTTQAMMLVCDDPSMNVKDVLSNIKGIGKGTAAVIASDTKKVMSYLQRKGRLLI